MLNEILEAQEYMYDLNNAKEKPERIVCGAFLKGKSPALSGIERILTIIGRRFVFPKNIDDIESISSEEFDARICRAAAALRMWCGLVPQTFNNKKVKEAYEELSKEPAFQCLENWLPNYLKKALENKRIKEEKYEAAINKLRSKKKPFAEPVFNLENSSNDYNAIKYDKVIANGLIANGPLREYCLVCDNRKWYEGIIKITEDRETKKKSLSPLREADRETILKVIAYYLLERRRTKKETADVSFEPTNFQALTFWIGVNKDSQKVKVYYFNDKLLFETRPVGEKKYILTEDADAEGTKKGVNATKIKPNEEWFAKCGWNIIDITDNDDALQEYLSKHPNAMWFTDNGGGKQLSKHNNNSKNASGNDESIDVMNQSNDKRRKLGAKANNIGSNGEKKQSRG